MIHILQRSLCMNNYKPVTKNSACDGMVTETVTEKCRYPAGPRLYVTMLRTFIVYI